MTDRMSDARAETLREIEVGPMMRQTIADLLDERRADREMIGVLTRERDQEAANASDARMLYNKRLNHFTKYKNDSSARIATLEAQAAAGMRAGLERAVEIVMGGSFLHDEAPPKMFAKEVSAAIRAELARLRAAPTDERARAMEAAGKALELHEAWEAHIILHADWSGPGGLPAMTQKQMDALPEIQSARNDALALIRALKDPTP